MLLASSARGSARPAVVLVLAGLVLAITTSASAQIGVSIIDFENRTTIPTLTTLGMVSGAPINSLDCDANANITFRYTPVPTGRANLHYFYGTDCMTTANRTTTTSTACTDLGVNVAINNNTMIDDMIPVSDLIDCASTSSGTRNIWVLALNDISNDVTADQVANFTVAYDFDGPSAPQDFTATPGEDSTTLAWSGSSDNINEYEVYMVPGGCVDGEVVTEIGDPPTISPVETISGSSSSAEINFTDDVALESQVAVAIRAIDQAGNASALSRVLCVQRTEVTTWWEAYCNTSPTPESCSSGGCSVRPRGGSPSSLAMLGAIAAALILVSRRRHT